MNSTAYEAKDGTHLTEDMMSESTESMSSVGPLSSLPLPTYDQLEEALEERVNEERRVQPVERLSEPDRRCMVRRKSYP